MMLDYREAVSVLLGAAAPLPVETVSSAEACGRILAADILAPRAFPDTPRSAVDGYALGDLESGSYRIREVLGAGEVPSGPLPPGVADAVMTGATVPEGCAAVARVEDVTIDGDTISIDHSVAAGDLVNPAGAEAESGARLLDAGRRLDPLRHAVLCHGGQGEVSVHRRPRVGLLVTGSELFAPGADHVPGKAYDCNRPYLQGVVEELGLECRVLGPLPDEPASLRCGLDELADTCDVVVSSGGVSVGKFDFMRPMLQSSGFELLVDRTNIRPGRPLLVARRDGRLFFGMPGYPFAFVVNTCLYLLPVLRKSAGFRRFGNEFRPARLTADARGRQGRWDVVRVGIDHGSEGLAATPLPDQRTSHFVPMVDCDGLLLVGPAAAGLSAGAQADVLDLAANPG
ncbi:MAG: molybdopterin molybdotransferase MoeA [bacterium]|nr:molybdopterin molybdotransferase MoeA [bacterium]